MILEVFLGTFSEMHFTLNQSYPTKYMMHVSVRKIAIGRFEVRKDIMIFNDTLAECHKMY